MSAESHISSCYLYHRVCSKKDNKLDFPGGTVFKNLPDNAGAMGFIPFPGRFPMLLCNWACEPRLLKPVCSRVHALQQNLVCLVSQSCPTHWGTLDCIPPGSSIHCILPARILEWVAISSSRGFSKAKNWTRVSCLTGRPTELQGKLSAASGLLKRKRKSHGCESREGCRCSGNSRAAPVSQACAETPDFNPEHNPNKAFPPPGLQKRILRSRWTCLRPKSWKES